MVGSAGGDDQRPARACGHARDFARFYAIAAGDLEVTVDGRVVARLGAGDSFGEIALLRRVPRTATVRALGDAELFALESDDFIPAMSQGTRAALVPG